MRALTPRAKMIVSILAGAFCVLSLYPYAKPRAPLLVYNGSASLPVGFYLGSKKEELERGDIVRLATPEKMAAILARWGYPHYLESLYLIKQVTGCPGDEVCRTGGNIIVGGVVMGPVHERDHMGYPLPQYLPEGVCENLGPDMYFVATPVGTSFDSRYFGPVPRDDIIQTLKPLWVSQATTVKNEGHVHLQVSR